MSLMKSCKCFRLLGHHLLLSLFNVTIFSVAWLLGSRYLFLKRNKTPRLWQNNKPSHSNLFFLNKIQIKKNYSLTCRDSLRQSGELVQVQLLKPLSFLVFHPRLSVSWDCFLEDFWNTLPTSPIHETSVPPTLPNPIPLSLSCAHPFGYYSLLCKWPAGWNNWL